MNRARQSTGKPGTRSGDGRVGAGSGISRPPSRARYGGDPPGALETIPGVGSSIARDLNELGIRQVRDLRGKNPQEMYDTLCALRGETIDRCVLYVFRCATYFASTESHDPELLKWWNWKDGAGNRQPESRGSDE